MELVKKLEASQAFARVNNGGSFWNSLKLGWVSELDWALFCFWIILPGMEKTRPRVWHFLLQNRVIDQQH